ncbi:MAG: uncharacterized protein QOD06_326 [Candidatus Binatota bacterium]|jgi:uncharacterized protein YcbX|nr:uncharacterized protein [Candidatus Binatota bacterium]
MRVGEVTEVWRFPVKSMAGERLDHATVGAEGIPGDRGFALRDEAAQEIRGAKKFPLLMRCAARYLREPGNGDIPTAEIRLPDGVLTTTDDPEISARLSHLLGKRVTLHPRRPRTDLEHYRRRLPEEPVALERELREIFGRLESEALPDLSIFPREILEYTSPLGTYFDAFPLHFLTTASIRALTRENPDASFDSRRFRPNFLIDCEGEGYVENGWTGKALRVGGITCKVEMPVVRCSMTTHAQQDLPKDPSVLRTIVQKAGSNVGIYATPLTPGEVKLGDPVELI